jgi:hypothetical protein
LVAFKRELYYCDCGLPAAQRTVVKQGANTGRGCLTCPKEREQQCEFFRMLPLCYCGVSADMAEKKDGGKYFRCGKKGGFCDFKDSNGPPPSPAHSPAKRQRTE